MQNNSSNKEPGWQHRLSEFEDVSDNNLDVDAAWNKLQQKKQVTEKTKKPWYWLAAACLVSLAFLLLHQSIDSTTTTSNAGSVKIIKANPAVENKIPVINNIPAIIENKTPEIVSVKKATVIKEQPVIPSKIKEEQNLMVMSEENPISAIIDIDTITLQSVPIVAAIKKLKVVHINEINQSGNTGIAKQEGKPYFPVNYKTKQVYTNNSGGKDNLIRIRLN